MIEEFQESGQTKTAIARTTHKNEQGGRTTQKLRKLNAVCLNLAQVSVRTDGHFEGLWGIYTGGEAALDG